MKDIINKEETLAFEHLKEVGWYKVKILPNHIHYAKFKGNTEGGIVKDPSCIGYDCWITSGCMNSGVVLGETIIIPGQYGAIIQEDCVVRNSYINVGSLYVANGSEIDGLTVSGDASPEVKLNIHQSVLSAKVNLWLTLSVDNLKSVNIKNSIISGITSINSNNLTIEDSNLSGGPFVISSDVKEIRGIYKSEAFEFRIKEKYLRDE